MNQPPLNPDSTLVTDELTRVAEALHGYDCPDDPEPGEACTCDGDTYYRMAELALEAAALPAPRTITTVEELEDLPYGSLVRANNGNEFYKSPVFDYPWSQGREHDRYASGYLAKLAPITVIHAPTEGGGE